MKAVSLYRRNPSGERNGMAKLTWETVRAIRAERSKSGASSAELAEMFNTSRQSISGIVFNHTWKEALIEPVSADHQSPTLEPKPD
jgi:ribosome-binding protein aMBF1 (putative translation factor)